MRRLALVMLVAFMLAGCGILRPAATARITTDSSAADAAAAQISAYRAARGLGPVKVDYALMRMAEHQARAVAEAGYLSHEVAGDFSRRLSQFGVRARAAAENLSAGSETVERTLQRWRASPGHNENLLLQGVSRIGLVQAHAPGTRYRRYWVLVLAGG